MRIKFSQIRRTQGLVKRHKQLDWIPNFLTIVKTTNRPHRFGRPLVNHLKPLHKIIISSWTFFKLLIRFEKFLLNYLKGINFGEYKISRISRSWPKVAKTLHTWNNFDFLVWEIKHPQIFLLQSILHFKSVTRIIYACIHILTLFWKVSKCRKLDMKRLMMKWSHYCYWKVAFPLRDTFHQRNVNEGQNCKI